MLKTNKQAFTLVELLAVIALLALLTTIAVPNVISTINNNKRNTFLLDAKRLVTKAESLINKDRNTKNDIINNNTFITYDFQTLNQNGEFPSDPDSSGNTYQVGYVKVTYDQETQKFKYCLYLKGARRAIGTYDNCLDSSKLTGIDVVLEID